MTGERSYDSSLYGERGSVWILEDSPLEAEMARRALATAHTVDVFVDGSTVLERIANAGPPDVLVVDWQLPGLSGLDVCKFLRETYDEIVLPILLMTTYGRKGDVIEGLAAGANDYLSKPYDPGELIARTSTLVRTSRLNQAQARRSRQLTMAAEVGVALTRARSMSAAASQCVEAISNQLDGASTWIFLCEDDRLKEYARAGKDAFAAPIDLIRDGLARKIVDSKERIFLVQAADAELAVGGSFAGYPLLIDNHVLGALAVLTASHLHADSLEALSSMADIVTLGLDRVRAEQERAILFDRELAARSEVERANLTKDQFLATVSHELRTPLNAIAGWVHLLRTGELSTPEVEHALETIERNTRAQTQLVDDLLDVSRIVSGNLRLQLSPVNLVSVIDMAKDAVAPAAEKKDIVLATSLDPDAGPVQGDADRLQQVVWNLLTNAVKFTPPKGRVEVSLRGEASWVKIRVKDTGIGIDEGFLPHVFERFRQAEGTLARKQGGLGLGLTIVRHLTELHGGTIAVTSKGEGQGTEFIVSLPVSEQAGRRSISKPRLPSERPSHPTHLAGLNVLVVDDDPIARDLMTTLLRHWKVEVTSASSAQEAIDLLRALQPDVLISDIGMPGEDGLSLIRRVRALPVEQGGSTPAVAVTAYARSEDRKMALMAGYNMHVPKPIDAGELVLVVANLAGRSHRGPLG
ncbi:response regulator [Pendulispora albinea]|uniref:histidine kinase n=1 Tax=Pendulispora albinea TaxID=2741071 RepID=A0ABZ2M7G9_9BACT